MAGPCANSGAAQPRSGQRGGLEDGASGTGAGAARGVPATTHLDGAPRLRAGRDCGGDRLAPASRGDRRADPSTSRGRACRRSQRPSLPPRRRWWPGARPQRPRPHAGRVVRRARLRARTPARLRGRDARAHRRLSGRSTRHLLLLKRQSGSLGDVLEVPPGFAAAALRGRGRREEPTSRVRAAFRADQTRLLRLKAGKRVELEWQS